MCNKPQPTLQIIFLFLLVGYWCQLYLQIFNALFQSPEFATAIILDVLTSSLAFLNLISLLYLWSFFREKIISMMINCNFHFFAPLGQANQSTGSLQCSSFLIHLLLIDRTEERRYNGLEVLYSPPLFSPHSPHQALQTRIGVFGLAHARTVPSLSRRLWIARLYIKQSFALWINL